MWTKTAIVWVHVAPIHAFIVVSDYRTEISSSKAGFDHNLRGIYIFMI